MRRKAIQLANKTIVVSLPAKWVRERGIKKGDEIEVEENGENLMIGSHEESYKKASIDISSLDEPMIFRYLNSVYREGCDEVRVTFDKPDKLKLLLEATTSLVGFEIIEQRSNECLIKDISGIKGEEFENVMKRIFFILISSSGEFLEILKGNRFDKLPSIVNSDDQLNKFTDYGLRLLNKSSITVIKKNILYHTIVQLEYIGDMLKLTAQKIINSNIKKVSSSTVALVEQFNLILDLIFSLFYKFNLDKITEMYKIRNRIEKIYSSKLKLHEAEKEINGYIKSISYILSDLVDGAFSLSI